MKLQYLGHSAFRIVSEMGNSVVCDPYSAESVGYSMPRLQCDIVTISHDHADHNYAEGLYGDPAIIDCEADFAADDICIKSFYTYHDAMRGAKRGKTLVFSFLTDGIKIAHMGDVGCYEQSVVKKLEGTEVLLIPIGGNYTIDALTAKRYVDEIAPEIVVPMHFADGGTLDIDGAQKFLSLYGNVTYLDSETLEIDESFDNEFPRVIFMKRYRAED